jgi:hypothetical protein
MMPKKMSGVDKLRTIKRQLRLQRLMKRRKNEKESQMTMYHASIAKKCLALLDQKRNGQCVIPARNGHMICVQEFQTVKGTSYAIFAIPMLKKRGVILPQLRDHSTHQCKKFTVLISFIISSSFVEILSKC